MDTLSQTKHFQWEKQTFIKHYTESVLKTLSTLLFLSHNALVAQ